MRWNLRMKAAERGIWKSTELRRMLAAAGLEISAGKAATPRPRAVETAKRGLSSPAVAPRFGKGRSAPPV
jgi:hypothetical protein